MVIVQAMELVKRMMSLMSITDVVRLFEVVGLGQDCWYLPMKRTLEIVGQQLMPGQVVVDCWTFFDFAFEYLGGGVCGRSCCCCRAKAS